MTDCLFCKIAAGEIPSTKIYEDELVYAFQDINPQAPKHILVIPRAHIVSAADITEENAKLAGACFAAISKIARAEGLDRGFRVITNCGEEGGQVVGHLHFHLLGGKKLGAMLV